MKSQQFKKKIIFQKKFKKISSLTEQKTFRCIYRCFNNYIYPFQSLSLGFILKIFLKFRKFQPRYSYKIYSYKKKREYLDYYHRIPIHYGNAVTSGTSIFGIYQYMIPNRSKRKKFSSDISCEFPKKTC